MGGSILKEPWHLTIENLQDSEEVTGTIEEKDQDAGGDTRPGQLWSEKGARAEAVPLQKRIRKGKQIDKKGRRTAEVYNERLSP